MSEKLYNELAKYYDLFNFNDYKKQADFVKNTVEKYLASRKDITILDLACGTGEHIKILKDCFRMEGRDSNDGMLEVSRAKNPEVNIEKSDLNDLHIENDIFTAIYCFSGSIQYVLDPAKLPDVLRTIYSGLKPDGVFIFDLSYCREKWQEGYVGIRTIVKDNLQLAEIFKSRSVENISLYNPIYLLNDNGNFKFYIDEHKIYLYAIKEVESVLKAVGFSKIFLKDNYSDNDFNNEGGRVPVFIAVK